MFIDVFEIFKAVKLGKSLTENSKNITNAYIFVKKMIKSKYYYSNAYKKVLILILWEVKILIFINGLYFIRVKLNFDMNVLV